MKKSKILSALFAIAVIFSLANFNPIDAQQTVEDQYWDAVKNSTKAEDFRSYLTEYPNGKYAAIARLKMNNGNSPASFLSFKTSIAMTNEAFMERWENQLAAQLPIKHENLEIYRAAAPTSLENYFYFSVRTPRPESATETRRQAGLLKTKLVSEYCKSEAAQRKITVVLGFTENTGNTYANHLSPKDCTSEPFINQSVIPVSANLTLQSGIQRGANGRNRIPVSRNDPAFTIEKLDINPAIYLDVKFSDGTMIGPHDYHKNFAQNVIFDDVSGDPNDLIQVSYWDIDSQNPGLGKFAAQLTSTGKGTGTAILKVSLRNAPNVSSSVKVEVVSGNLQNSMRQTDIDFLNKWAAEVRVDLPEAIGNFQLITAESQCPKGCQNELDPDGGNELALIFKTTRYNSQSNFDTEVIPALKPLLLPEYCNSEGMKRNIYLGVFVLDQNDRQINNFFVFPKDCSSNNSSNISQNPDVQQTDAEFLNKWATEVRAGLPEWIAGFQLKTAWSRCPAGCQENDSSPYLLLKFNAEGEQQYAGIADLEKDLKPALLTEYCKTDAIRRNIMLGVFFDNRAQNQKVNFWVSPKDCSIN